MKILDGVLTRLLGRRRRFLVDPLQRRLLFVNALYFWGLVLLTAALLFLPPMAVLLAEDAPFEAQRRAAEEMLALHQRFWPATLLVFALFAVHTVLVSHRFAGPLVRFRRIWAEMAAGDLGARVRLRKGDYLHREAAAFNELADALELRVRSAEAAAVACVEGGARGAEVPAAAGEDRG